MTNLMGDSRDDKNVSLLIQKSILYREEVLRIINQADSGHTGGSLSCIDILNVLYNHVMNIKPENFDEIIRDHYIHSKGHSVEALYVVLLDQGFFNRDELYKLESYQSPFIGHPSNSVPGIEQNTGALGHGLSISVGMAIADKLDGHHNRFFTLLGDGELAEGSNWEACGCASHYNLDNLVAIIDRNSLQISGYTEEVMRLEPLREKFESFGFAVEEVDGHNIPDLVELFDRLPFKIGKPNLVIAHTIKGKGISFIENQVNWHHRVPTEDEYKQALKELDNVRTAWEQKHDH